MKKTLITLSIICFIGFTYSNYTIKTPLEVNQGGNLPQGSIKFKQQSHTIPDTYSCSINEYSSLTGWRTLAGACTDGVLVFQRGLGTVTGTCSNGSYFYRNGMNNISGVCNTPIPTEDWQTYGTDYSHWFDNEEIYWYTNWSPNSHNFCISAI